MTVIEASGDTAVWFDAELRPNRSLSPTGFLLLLSGIALVSFGAGLAFALMGAWPVVGFFGLDVLLLYLAFRANYRSGRARELVQLLPDRLLVRRTTADGRETVHEFEPYWARLLLIADGERARQSRLVIASHGRELAIGDFLCDAERELLHDSLTDALARWKSTPLSRS
jgi:uncharacterized membrane protein